MISNLPSGYRLGDAFTLGDLVEWLRLAYEFSKAEACPFVQPLLYPLSYAGRNV